jgi:hypothetical protein
MFVRIPTANGRPVCRWLAAAIACTLLASLSGAGIGPTEKDFNEWIAREQILIPPELASKPYQPRSLKGMSPKEMLDWMDQGRSLTSYENYLEEQRTASLPDIWTAPIDGVIRSRFESGRTELANRQNPLRFRPTKGRLPDSGALTYRLFDTYHYDPQTTTIQLRWNSDDSWIAVGEDLNISAPENGPLEDRQGLPLSFAKLKYEDARRIAELIANLSRDWTPIKGSVANPTARKEDDRMVGGHSYSSYHALKVTADGKSPFLEMSGEGMPRISTFGGRKLDWGWSNESALLLANSWLVESIPSRLRTLQPEFQPSDLHGFQCPAFEEKSLDQLPAKEIEKMRVAATHVLKIAVSSPELMPRAIVSVAIATAGEFGFEELRPEIRFFAARLPRPSTWDLRNEELAVELYQKSNALAQNSDPAVADFLKEWRPGSYEFRYRAAREALAKLRKEDRALLERVNELNQLREKHCPRWPKTAAENPDRTVANQRRVIARALRQLSTRDDKVALSAWAREPSFGAGWAYRRLRKVDLAAAAGIMQEAIERDKSKSYAWQQLAEQFLTEFPERAKAMMAGWPEMRREALLPHVRETVTPAPVPVPEILARVSNTSLDEGKRISAVEQLVPRNQPKLNDSDEIDEFLIAILRQELSTPRLGDTSIYNSLAVTVCRALARRDVECHWDTVAGAIPQIHKRERARFDRDMLEMLIPAVAMNPGVFRPKFATLFAEQLSSPGWPGEILMLAWIGDLREQRDFLASVATSNPDDYGADSLSGSHDEKDIRGPGYRFHNARQIASMWDERDDATRLQLLGAYALANFRNTSEGVRAAQEMRLRKDLAGGMARLTEAEQKQVLDQFDGMADLWCAYRDWTPENLQFVRAIREIMTDSK